MDSVASSTTTSYNTDEGGYNPVDGQEGSVDLTYTDENGVEQTMTDTDGDGYVDDFVVAVSDESLEESTSAWVPRFLDLGTRGWGIGSSHPRHGVNTQYKAGIHNLLNSLFASRTAHAADETTNYCAMDGVTTWPITTGGAFTAYHPGTSSSTMYIYLTDCEVLSEGITETPNTHLLWFSKSTLDIGATGTGSDSQQYFHALTEDTGVSVVERSGTFAVQEDYEQSYRNFTATDATLLAYASGYEGLLEATTGISLLSSLFDTGLLDWVTRDTGTDTTVAYTAQYTVIKTTTKGDVWFGRKPEEALAATAGFYDFVYKIDYSGINDPDYAMKIYNSDPTTNPEMYTYDFGQTINFDLDSNKVALAIFTASDGTYRMSMGYYDNLLGQFTINGGTTSFDPSTYNFRDLAMFNAQSGTTTGNYLVLDAGSNVVWVKTYFGNTSGDPSLTDTFTETLSDSVSVGNGATNIALSDNTAFVLNGDDNTITAFRIKSDSGTVLTATQMTSTIQTISLSDYLNGKSVTLSGNKIIYQSTASGNYLMISTPGIKGAMVLEAPSLTDPTPTRVPVRTRSRRN